QQDGRGREGSRGAGLQGVRDEPRFRGEEPGRLRASPADPPKDHRDEVAELATHATAARRPFALMPGGLRVDPLAIAAAIPIVLILILLGAVARLSFQETIYDDTPTVRHFAELATDPAAAIALRNTALFAVLTAFWAMVFGLPFPGLGGRWVRGKRAASSPWGTMGVFTPGFISAWGGSVSPH